MALLQSKAPPAKDSTNQRTRKAEMVDVVERGNNRNKSKTWARVEQDFAVVERLSRFSKVRQRGQARNAMRASVALGLANICLARARLLV